MSEHLVIAGGGVGALEALLAFRSFAADPPEISVLTAGRHLTYRAFSVTEPFGADPGPHYEWPEIVRDRGVRWIPDVLVGVRPDARKIETRDGPPIRYDALLLALGAHGDPRQPDHAQPVRRRSVSAPSARAATVAAAMTAASTAIPAPSGSGRVARASAS